MTSTKVPISYSNDYIGQNSKPLIELLFGKNVDEKTISENTLAKALDYKVESEKTMQQYYKLEVLIKSIELINIAKDNGLLNDHFFRFFQNEILKTTNDLQSSNTNLASIHNPNFGIPIHPIPPVTDTFELKRRMSIPGPHLQSAFTMQQNKNTILSTPSSSSYEMVSPTQIDSNSTNSQSVNESPSSNFFHYKYSTTADNIKKLEDKPTNINIIDHDKTSSFPTIRKKTAPKVTKNQSNSNKLLPEFSPPLRSHLNARRGSIDVEQHSNRIRQKRNSIAEICNTPNTSINANTTVETKPSVPVTHTNNIGNSQLKTLSRNSTKSSIPSTMTSILAFTKEADPSTGNSDSSKDDMLQSEQSSLNEDNKNQSTTDLKSEDKKSEKSDNSSIPKINSSTTSSIGNEDITTKFVQSTKGNNNSSFGIINLKVKEEY